MTKEDLDKANCYKALQPDPFGAPAHVIHTFTPKDENSKRTQKRLKVDASHAKKVIDKKLKNKNAKVANEPRGAIKLQKFENDLWSESTKFQPEINQTNEHFLRTTKKIMPKVENSHFHRIFLILLLN